MHTRTHPHTHLSSILTHLVSVRGYERAHACHLNRWHILCLNESISEASGAGAHTDIYSLCIYLWLYIYYNNHHTMCCMFVRWCCIHSSVYTYKVCTLMLHTFKCLHIHGWPKRYRYVYRYTICAACLRADVAYTWTHSRQSGDAAVRPELLKKKKAKQAAMMLRNLSSREGAIHRIVASPFLRCLQVFFPTPSNHLSLFVHELNLFCFIRLRDRGGEGGWKKKI
jgi:hypothetical protein